MRTVPFVAIMALATNQCLAADTSVADALLRISAQKQAIKNAINLRRSGLITNQSFRTYADAINKICTAEPITNVANASKDSAVSALSLLSGTKDAIRAAISGRGVSVSASDPLSMYATKIKAINCPGSPGFVNGDILTTNRNPEDKKDFQCANATVCKVLANATSCDANTIWNSTGVCIGSASISDWKLLYSFNTGTFYEQSMKAYPLTVGNVYRFDMRSATCAKSWMYMPGHNTGLYSFQLNCDTQNDCPCVGMVTAKNPDDPGYDFSTNSGMQWIKAGMCGANSCDDYLSLPGVSKEMVMAAQPAASLRIYKLGE
jgi:hypothetical protein